MQTMAGFRSALLMQGLSLLELLLALLLLSVLLGMAMPGFSEVVQQQRIDLTARQLRQAIEVGRNAAITGNSMVTLCRSRTGDSCAGQWGDGVLVFVDYDTNGALDSTDRVVRHFAFTEFDGAISWRAFRNRQYLQITAAGFTNYQNGNFTLCPADGDRRLARQLIISRTARVRQAEDENGDGIREDSRGQPLQCS